MKKSLLDKTKQLTDVATKKKFLKWLRENKIPYVLECTGNFTLGAAYCRIDGGYLCASFGSLISGYDTDFSCSCRIGDCFTAFNRFAFINNRFCDITHSPKSYKLAAVELPEILKQAAERERNQIVINKTFRIAV